MGASSSEQRSTTPASATMKAIGRAPHGGLCAISRDTFNPRWTLDCARARAEEHEWHAELARNKPVILADRGVD
jgi:hypothetical protein